MRCGGGQFVFGVLKKEKKRKSKENKTKTEQNRTKPSQQPKIVNGNESNKNNNGSGETHKRWIIFLYQCRLIQLYVGE